MLGFVRRLRAVVPCDTNLYNFKVIITVLETEAIFRNSEVTHGRISMQLACEKPCRVAGSMAVLYYRLVIS